MADLSPFSLEPIGRPFWRRVIAWALKAKWLEGKPTTIMEAGMRTQEQLKLPGIPQLQRQATHSRFNHVCAQQEPWKDGLQGESELLQSDSGGWVAGGLHDDS